MRIAISGGGTGGHLIIAKTFAQELKNRGIETIFIGSTAGQDRAWFRKSDIFDKKFFLKSSGVVDKKGIKKIASAINILKLSFRARKILQKYDVAAVISVGGYSAAPASLACLGLRLPLFIHEQNAILGRLNKSLKKKAEMFYSSYFEPKFTYPVDEIFFKTARIRQNLQTIIFLGGSQGALFINELAMKLAPKLAQKGIRIIHQCGAAHYENVKKFYDENGIEAEVIGFCTDLYEKMHRADLCVGRSGASTLWELCANCLPTIFVPFKFAAKDHQFYNAKFLADQNAAKVFRQDDDVCQDANAFLEEILSTDLAQFSQNLRETIKLEKRNEIIEDILKRIKKHS